MKESTFYIGKINSSCILALNTETGNVIYYIQKVYRRKNKVICVDRDNLQIRLVFNNLKEAKEAKKTIKEELKKLQDVK